MSPRKPAAGPLSAFVLHSWDWSETSLIVDLFTRERGRIAVAAKGAKRPYSQLRAVLLPFQRITVQLGRAPADEAAEVHLLRSADWAAGHTMPRGPALFAAFYLNELLIKLLARHDPFAQLFDAYASTLAALLEVGDTEAQVALRAFELTLLRETGVLPELGVETLTQQPVRPAQAYAVDAEAGVVASECEPNLRGTWLLQAEAALAQRDAAALRDSLRPATTAWRAVLRQLLQYHVGSPTLRTRQVMADVQKLADGEPHRNRR